MNEPGVQIDGLKAFTRALKRADPDMADAVKSANFDAANEIVSKARGVALGVGGVASKAAASLRATKTQNYAAVRLGGAAYPFSLGAEFGAKQYPQFKRWRGNQFDSGGWEGGPGYFVHPAIRQFGPEVIDRYWKRLQGVIAPAFDG